MTFPGAVVGGRYRIERLLGEGGMGRLFVATDVRLERPVAVKFLHEQLVAADPTFAERFRQEALAACRIRHPAVVEIYDADVQDGCPWMAMALLDGETLGGVLARRALTIDETIWVALETLDGLVAVHQAGFVHRDLKPDNLFLQHLPRGRVQLKLLDFGIVKQVAGRESTTLTATGATIGTPWYVSPEQAAGSKALDHRSDIYSLGVILFECLTRRRPFEAESFGALITKFYTDAPARLTDLMRDAPPALTELLHACVALDPAARPGSAQELMDRIAALGIAPRPLEHAGTPGAYAPSSPSGSTVQGTAPGGGSYGRAAAAPVAAVAAGPGSTPGAALGAGPSGTQLSATELHVGPPRSVAGPAPRRTSGLAKVAALGGVVVLVVLVAFGGYVAWRRLRGRKPVPAAPAPIVVATTQGAGGTTAGVTGPPAGAGAGEPLRLADVGLSGDPAAGPGIVVVGSATQAEGTGAFSPSVVTWALTERADAFAGCYEQARRARADASGALRVRLVLTQDGTVSQAEVADSGLDAATGECVLAAIRPLRFQPGPAGGSVTYACPLFFGFGHPRPGGAP